MKGIINIYKPQDYTSHDCVAVMRRLTGVKRIGHTGTLDPMATGVLPVCIGNAARIMEYLDNDIKEYRCTMKLGVETETYDIWGNVLDEKDIGEIGREEIEKVLSGFRGEISQYPPKYSALKVNGKKLYQYARAGEDVEIKPRSVTIYGLDICSINGDMVEFTVRCSKGTYIRSICHDAGEKLGCGGTMAALERTASGVFGIDTAVDIEKLKSMDKEEIESLLYSTDHPLGEFGKIQLERQSGIDFINGKRIDFDNAAIKEKTQRGNRYRIYFEDTFIGIGDIANDEKLKADKVFNTEI